MPSWNWDEELAAAGVAHESVTNTDHTNAAELVQGYPYGNLPEPASLEVLYPLDEDSGSTMYDASGNGRDGSINGPTVGVAGDLGTTAHDFDGTDDDNSIPYGSALSGFAEITVVAVVNPDNLANGTYQRIVVHDQGNQVFQLLTNNDTADIGWRINNGSWHGSLSFASLSENAWQLVGGTYDGSNVYGYKDGSESNLASTTGSLNSESSDLYIGAQGGGQRFFDGQVGFVGIWSTALTTSQMQSLSDVLNTAGQWTGSKKTL